MAKASANKKAGSKKKAAPSSAPKMDAVKLPRTAAMTKASKTAGRVRALGMRLLRRSVQVAASSTAE